MGTCCSKREEKADKTSLTAGQTKPGSLEKNSVKFSKMDEVKKTVGDILNESKLMSILYFIYRQKSGYPRIYNA